MIFRRTSPTVRRFRLGTGGTGRRHASGGDRRRRAWALLAAGRSSSTSGCGFLQDLADRTSRRASRSPSPRPPTRPRPSSPAPARSSSSTGVLLSGTGQEGSAASRSRSARSQTGVRPAGAELLRLLPGGAGVAAVRPGLRRIHDARRLPAGRARAGRAPRRRRRPRRRRPTSVTSGSWSSPETARSSTATTTRRCRPVGPVLEPDERGHRHRLRRPGRGRHRRDAGRPGRRVPDAAGSGSPSSACSPTRRTCGR